MKIALWIPFALLTLIVGGVVACGGDDDDTGEVTQPGATEGARGNGAGGRAGTATLTIGDESWSFDGVGCAVGAERTRSEEYPFSMLIRGETAEGARIQVVADVWDRQDQGRLEGDDVTFQIEVTDIDDFDNPSIGWSMNRAAAQGGSEPRWSIDGKEVNVSAVFDDDLTPDIEAIPGTFVATCP